MFLSHLSPLSFKALHKIAMYNIKQYSCQLHNDILVTHHGEETMLENNTNRHVDDILMYPPPPSRPSLVVHAKNCV